MIGRKSLTDEEKRMKITILIFIFCGEACENQVTKNPTCKYICTIIFKPMHAEELRPKEIIPIPLHVVINDQALPFLT